MDHLKDLPPLIQALLDPTLYPSSARGQRQRPVDLLQTHISWVLLAGDFAYKVKKPLKLPFLDFSTLALRKRCCEDELRLNRRHAPDIYLQVIAICDTPHGPRFDGGAGGTPIEYAVKMRRFDEAGRLDHLCARGALTAAHVSDLAAAVSDFHAEAAVAPAESRFGAPQHVLAPMLDNFHDLAELVPDADMQQRLHVLRNWTEQQFTLLTPLLHSRKDGGMVRECHGDLHLANMVLIDGRVRLFDCLEFSEDLRWTDVASDVAFAYVDLLEHGQAGLANWLANEVLGHSGDYVSAALLRFYGVYRAMVRAKVAAIRARQTPEAANGGGGGADAETDAIRLCLSHAEGLAAPAPVRLVITHGLAGCGKTFASTRLLQQGGAWQRTLRLRSDVERKRLHGLALAQPSGSATGEGIYSADAHARTYAHLLATTQQLLLAGWSVLVDAAFLQRAQRDSFQALATQCGAGFCILAPQADTDMLRQRIRARQAMGTDASEATLDVLEKQLQSFDALGDDEKQWVLDAAQA